MYFRNLVLSAFFIAIIAGLLFSLYQALFISPIILDSEIYEMIEPATAHIIPWAPEDGLERHSWSFATNFLISFAYSLILLSAMSIRTEVDAVSGLFWGWSAFLCVFAAPALGLPPEIPGMEAAYLQNRQVWWLFTVGVTAISLYMVILQPGVYKLLGLILMTVPHLIGAPQPEVHGFSHPEIAAREALNELWYHFVIQTSLANVILWLLIGGLSGFLVKKYIYPIDLLTTNTHEKN